MDNKALLDALEQIPNLINAAQTYKATSDRIITTLAEAVKKRPQAILPAEELEKIKEVIKTTPCAKPDITLISRELARRISGDVADAIKPAVRNAASEALKGASVLVEHSHVIERNLKDVADKKMKKTNRILWGVIIILVLTIGISAITYFCGETYWGKQFYDVYTSKYLTPEEKANLKENSFLLSVLPRGYREDTATAQLQIKQYKEILKKREKDAKKK